MRIKMILIERERGEKTNQEHKICLILLVLGAPILALGECQTCQSPTSEPEFKTQLTEAELFSQIVQPKSTNGSDEELKACKASAKPDAVDNVPAKHPSSRQDPKPDVVLAKVDHGDATIVSVETAGSPSKTEVSSTEPKEAKKEATSEEEGVKRITKRADKKNNRDKRETKLGKKMKKNKNKQNKDKKKKDQKKHKKSGKLGHKKNKNKLG